MKHKYNVSRVVSHTESVEVWANDSLEACKVAQDIFENYSDSDDIDRFAYNIANIRAELDEEQLVIDLLNAEITSSYIEKMFKK